MDQQNININEDQKKKLTDDSTREEELNKYYPSSRRALVVVLSLSLLSLFLILTYFSDGPSIFPYSLTHTLERKYMFFICNGILAFLAKTSSPSRDVHADFLVAADGKYSSPSSAALVADHHDHDHQRDQVVQLLVESSDDSIVEKEQVLSLRADGANLRGANINEDEGVNDGVLEGSGLSETASEEEEEDDEDEDEEESISTEELNRKIEEFIRKMKEEIRIEAQQQLIPV